MPERNGNFRTVVRNEPGVKKLPALFRFLSELGIPTASVAGIVTVAIWLGGLVNSVLDEVEKNNGDVSRLNSKVTRICETNNNLSSAVLGIIAVDNELSEHRNDSLRHTLTRQLKSLNAGCK